MPKEEYGLYQQGILLVNLFGGLFLFSISSSYYYFFQTIDIGDKPQFIWQSNLVLFILAIIFLIVFFFLQNVVQVIVKNEQIDSLIKPIGFCVFFFLLSDPFEHLLVVEEKSKYVVILLVLQSLFKSALIILTYFLSNSVSIALYALGIFYSIKFCFYLIYTSINYGSFLKLRVLKKGLLKDQFSYSFPLGIGNFVGIVSERIDKLILSAHFTSTDYAMYSIAQFRIPVVSLIFPSVSNVLGPKIAICSRDNNIQEATKLWHKMINKFSLVVIPFTIFSIFTANELLSFLYTEAYIEAAFYYKIFLCTFFIQMLSRGIILNSFGYTKYIFKVKLATLVLSAVIGFSLIPKYGILGATLSYVIVFYFGGILQLTKVKSILKLKLKNWLPYANIIKLFAISFLCVLLIVPLKILISNNLIFLVLSTTLFGITYIILVDYFSFANIRGYIINRINTIRKKN